MLALPPRTGHQQDCIPFQTPAAYQRRIPRTSCQGPAAEDPPAKNPPAEDPNLPPGLLPPMTPTYVKTCMLRTRPSPNLALPTMDFNKHNRRTKLPITTTKRLVTGNSILQSALDTKSRLVMPWSPRKPLAPGTPNPGGLAGRDGPGVLSG